MVRDGSGWFGLARVGVGRLSQKVYKFRLKGI